MSKMSNLHLQLQEARANDPEDEGYHYQCYLEHLQEQEEKDSVLTIKTEKNEQRNQSNQQPNLQEVI
jgi:hypothetical protein